MADDSQQISMGDDTHGDEKTVRFDSDLFQAGFTSMPNTILLDSGLSVAARMVYLGLSFFAREKEECFPGQDKFAERMGISERTMRSGLRELENAGLVRSKRRRGRSNLYTLLTPGSGKSDRSEPADSAALNRQNLPLSKKKQLEVDADRNSKADSQKKEIEERSDREVKEVWDHYVTVFDPGPGVKCGPNRVKGIKRALQEVDVATLVRAIDGLKNFRAHKPGDTTIETIWKTFKGTGTMVERINFFASQSKGSAPGQKSFPSAQRAIVAQRQNDVQRGHGSSNEDIVQRAKESEAWLLEHGIETVRRESDGYPIFRAMSGEGGAS